MNQVPRSTQKIIRTSVMNWGTTTYTHSIFNAYFRIYMTFFRKYTNFSNFVCINQQIWHFWAPERNFWKIYLWISVMSWGITTNADTIFPTPISTFTCLFLGIYELLYFSCDHDLAHRSTQKFSEFFLCCFVISWRNHHVYSTHFNACFRIYIPIFRNYANFLIFRVN